MKATKLFAALALILGLVSCQPEMFNGNGDKADSKSVQVTMSVKFPEPIPVATKGTMAEGPLASEAFDIHLCLYGPGDGYVQNWITASKESTTTTTIDGVSYITGGTFNVFLPITDEKRTIHIIANPPDAVNPTTDDYLDNVMEKMVNQKNATTGAYECSYWQEIVLEHGIHAASGDPHSSGLPYASSDVVAAFTNIQLLRNFAKIIVEGPSAGEGAFVLENWALINVPKKGYVAPYTGNSESRFPTGYSNTYLNEHVGMGEHWVDNMYNQLTVTDKYLGYMPNDEHIIDESLPTVFLSDGQCKYMYERPLPTTSQKQTAVLIKVRFLEGHSVYDSYYERDHEEGAEPYTYWYKVEVLNDKGAYFPILRNFVFTMHIDGIAEAGYDTAELAFAGSYFGNISASLETAGLSDLSNGKSQIHVDLLDYSFTGIPQSGKILLMNGSVASQFYFIPNVLTGERYTESADGICTITISVEKVPGYEEDGYQAIASIDDVEIGEGGTITITPTAISSDHMKKSIIRVEGKAAAEGSKALYRDIMITMMETPSLIWVDSSVPTASPVKTAIISTPEGTTGAKHPVYLRVCLPEGLGSSLFPIQLRIEAENNTLSATSPDLPVQTGVSEYDPTRNTFYYIYTIKYSDYCKLNPRTMKYEYKYVYGDPSVSGIANDYIVFYTNKVGNNYTKIKIRDMANRFTPVELTLGTPPNNP